MNTQANKIKTPNKHKKSVEEHLVFLMSDQEVYVRKDDKLREKYIMNATWYETGHTWYILIQWNSNWTNNGRKRWKKCEKIKNLIDVCRHTKYLRIDCTKSHCVGDFKYSFIGLLLIIIKVLFVEMRSLISVHFFPFFVCYSLFHVYTREDCVAGEFAFFALHFWKRKTNHQR